MATQAELQDQTERARRFGSILTAEDRTRWIEQIAAAKKASKVDKAHQERLRIIYKPFPVVRRMGGRIGEGSAATWAGTIVTDTFFGERERPVGKHGAGNRGKDDMDTISSYNGLYANALERAMQ